MWNDYCKNEFIQDPSHKLVEKIINMGFSSKKPISKIDLLRSGVSENDIRNACLHPAFIETGYIIDGEFIKKEDASRVISKMEDHKIQRFLDIIFLKEDSEIVRLSEQVRKFYLERCILEKGVKK